MVSHPCPTDDQENDGEGDTNGQVFTAVLNAFMLLVPQPPYHTCISVFGVSIFSLELGLFAFLALSPGCGTVPGTGKGSKSLE